MQQGTSTAPADRLSKEVFASEAVPLSHSQPELLPAMHQRLGTESRVLGNTVLIHCPFTLALPAFPGDNGLQYLALCSL